MAGKPIGTIFVELDLDASKYTAAQKQIIRGANQTTLAIEKNWSSLGTQSDKMFDLMRQKVMNAYTQITQTVQKGTAEWIRLEAMKNARLREIYDQQFNYQSQIAEKTNKISRDSAAGWQSMMKGMIAYRLILESINLAHEATIGVLTKGIQKIDEFKQAQASMGAAIASNANFKGTFDQAYAVAEALTEKIDELDRKFIGTADELRILADSMVTFGMGIDLSTKKAQDQFVAFGNTIKLLTRGQDFQRQAMQEVRALMEGENVQGALLVKKIEAAGYNAKLMIPIWKEQGVLLEKLTEIFKGYGGAGEKIENTLQGQKSTLETITNKLLREGMQQAYDDIRDAVREVNNALFDMNGLTDKGLMLVRLMRGAWMLVRDVVWGFIDPLGMVKNKVEEIRRAIAKQSNQEMEDQLLFGNVENAITMLSYLNDELARVTRSYEAWNSYLKSIDPTILGNQKRVDEAAEATGYWADEMTRLQDKIRTAEAAIKGMSAGGLVVPPGAGKDDSKNKEDEKFWKSYFDRMQKDYLNLVKDFSDNSISDVLALDAERSKALMQDLAAAYGAGLQQMSSSMKDFGDNSDTTITALNEQAALSLQIWKDSLTEIASLMSDLGNQGTGDVMSKLEEMMALREKLYADTDILSEQESFFDSIVGYEEEAYDKKKKILDEYAAYYKGIGMDAVAVDAWRNQQELKSWSEMQQKRLSIASNAAGNLASIAESIYKMTGEKNRAAFTMMKAFRVAETVMDTAKGAIAAYSSQAGIPIVGPALGAIAAAAVVAAGAAQIQQIQSAQPGGSGSVSFSGGGAMPSAPSTVLGAAPGTASESVGNVGELLKDIYSIEYRELTGIHTSMKELNQNIKGFIDAVFRAGAFRAASFGAQEGVIKGGSKAFGGAINAAVVEAGLSVRAQQIGDLIVGEYVNSIGYAIIEKSKSGGWFGSKKTWQEFISFALNADQQKVDDMIKKMFIPLGESIVEMTMQLGGDVEKAKAYVFKAATLNLTGLSPEDMEKKVNAFFSELGDVAVESILGRIVTDYQRVGEGAFETAGRLVVELAVVMESIEMVGKAFEGTKLEAIALSQDLIFLAGDLETLTTAIGEYYDKFYTDVEKQARIQGILTGAFEDLNLALPMARDAYRDLVESLDLSTESGQRAFVAMMQMSEMADEYYTYLEKAQEDYLKGQAKMWDDLLKQQEKYVDTLKARIESVNQWLSEMERGSSTTPVGSVQAWEREYARQRELAMAPAATDKEISSFMSYSKEFLAYMRKYTGGDYREIFASVMGDVQSLGDAAAAALPAAEQQLAVIKEMAEAARIAAGEQLTETQQTNELLAQLLDRVGTLSGVSPVVLQSTENLPTFAVGGLMKKPSIGGEKGPEWAVPTYEPERSRFLKDVGADPDSIGKSVARHLGGLSSGGGGKDININLYLDGKVISNTVVKGIRSGDPELVKYIRKAVA